jgi:hypothetical protein
MKERPQYGKRILVSCLHDALGLAALVLLISGGYGLFMSGSSEYNAAETIVPTLKWMGIAFGIGCVTGLRHLFK